MIDFDKPVQMKSGIPVIILTKHLMGSDQILGKANEVYCIWKRDGSCFPDGYSPKDDLENVPEELLTTQTATGGNLSFFDQVVQERTDKIHNTLYMKAKEYASTTDRFHNFRVAARKMNTTPEIALQGMMAKHEVAVLDMIVAPDSATEKMIDEKIGDNINYLILLEGLLKKRLNR